MATTIEIQQEEELVRLAKADIKNFRALYEKYYKPIFLFVYHRTGDQQATADIVSQVFLKAMGSINKYKPMGLPFSAWLYRIAVNEANQYFNKNKKDRYVTIDEDMVGRICEEAKGPDKEMVINSIENILQGLPKDQIELIVLRFFENKTYAEIAYITGNSETNVKTKTWRILEKIRQSLQEKYI